MNVREYFGGIDIYLFDQIQKGVFKEGMKILDIGCGSGRNLVYFMRNGFDVYAVDSSSSSIKNCIFLTKQLNPSIPESNFRVEFLEDLSFEDETFDYIISSAVFHFAENDKQFLSWIQDAWRVLKVGGIMFSRLASSIGIEDKIEKIEGNRYKLPDTSDRYLVNEQTLLSLNKQLKAEMIEPIKTTNVHNLRAMTTWIIRKTDKEIETNDLGMDDSGGLMLFRE